MAQADPLGESSVGGDWHRVRRGLSMALMDLLEQLRRQQLEELVNAPQARPPKTDTIVESIRKAIDAAKRTIIDLGVIHPEGGGPTPYEPETNHGIDQPGPPAVNNSTPRRLMRNRIKAKSGGGRAGVWAPGTGSTGKAPESPTIDIGNYRGGYLHRNGVKRLPGDWDVHHAIPQEY
ncbi:hypothetical protein ABT332_02980 [Saccharomonospora azurea]|uniref:hypothetical protein n=1 Tax=Saccharomonospora azurea TaxID=40988 RepID=UPI00332E1BBD